MSTATRIEKPMLFSAPMIRAILDGRKTQTRRVIKTNAMPDKVESITNMDYDPPNMWCVVSTSEPRQWFKCPHPVGSLIWARETWANTLEDWDHFNMHAPRHRPVLYKSIDPEAPVKRWRPSIHMPKWAARIWLEVTDVRVERLQDISEADARAEGMPQTWDGKCYDPPPPEVDSWQGYGRASFALLWSKLNGPDSWDANPWVRVYTFKRVTPDPDSGGAA